MESLRTHHVGVTVSDLDRLVGFYRDVLGLDLVAEFTVTGAAFAEGVGVPDATGHFAHLDGGGARIELVAYEPEGPSRPTGDVNEPGAAHLGFAVDDVDGFYAELPPEVETVSAPRTTESGTRILFLRDPEGNLVEVLEG